MSMAEVFLMVWALGATLVAVYFQHKYKRAEHFAGVSQVILIGMAEGTAKMIKEKNGATFINLIEGEITDEIRFKTRQG
jgi:hypothetical protein